MRGLSNPSVIEAAEAWCAETLERAAQFDACVSTMGRDAGYWARLLRGNVAWVRIALPVRASDRPPRASRFKRALERLGLTAADARGASVLARYYLRVWEASQRNATIAAKVLGVGRTTFQRFLARRQAGQW